MANDMRTRTAFRIVVVAEWVVIVAGLVATFSLEGSLPPLLQEYLEWEANQPLITSDIVLLAVVLLPIPLCLISSIGLFFFKNWARWLYLACSLLIYSTSLFFGPTVEHGVAGVIDDLSVVLEGFILGLAFFGNVIPQARTEVNST